MSLLLLYIMNSCVSELDKMFLSHILLLNLDINFVKIHCTRPFKKRISIVYTIRTLHHQLSHIYIVGVCDNEILFVAIMHLIITIIVNTN